MVNDIDRKEQDAIRGFLDPTAWVPDATGNLRRELANGFRFKVGGGPGQYVWEMDGYEGDPMGAGGLATHEEAMKAALRALGVYLAWKAVTQPGLDEPRPV